jgi:hypothetical protein
MVPLIAFFCVLEFVRQRKSFPTEKRTVVFFLLCLICDFSPKKNYFTTVSGSESNVFRIRIKPKYSDYFGFGSKTLVAAQHHKTVPVPQINAREANQAW